MRFTALTVSALAAITAAAPIPNPQVSVAGPLGSITFNPGISPIGTAAGIAGNIIGGVVEGWRDAISDVRDGIADGIDSVLGNRPRPVAYGDPDRPWTLPPQRPPPPTPYYGPSSGPYNGPSSGPYNGPYQGGSSQQPYYGPRK